MKKLLLVFLMVFSLFCPLPPAARADTTAVRLSVSERGLGFSLMQQTASTFFSISLGEFQTYQTPSAPHQIFSLLYLAAETNNPPAVIWQKRKGHGWGNIAKAYGLPPNYHGKYISSKHKKKYVVITELDDKTFEEMMTLRFLHEYYGTEIDLLFYWHAKGLSYHDLFLAVNLGARLQVSPVEIFELRISGKDWRFIAGKYKVTYGSLSQPVKPLCKVPVTVKEDSFPPGKEKGKGNGKKK